MCERTKFGLLMAAALVVWGALLAGTARADGIVAITDGQGRTVYVNTDETVVREVHGGQAPAAAPASEMPPAKRSDPPAKLHNTSNTTPEISQLVEQTASRHKVDPQLVHAIIKVESAYDPLAVSNKGAMGLMQLIPKTAHELGVVDPFDPQENIEGGVTYLRHLLNVFGGDLNLSLAAYNAGEGAVRRYGGVPFFAETRDYVRRVTNIYQSLPSLAGAGDAESKPLAAVSPIVRFLDERGVVHYSNVE
jgi:soluble lytic murein transglycosylase-like protein